MKAYISISYRTRKRMDAEIQAIKEVLSQFGIKPFVFVDEFSFNKNEEKQMMQKAVQSVDECDILIAETSDKAIGVGVEVGYAKAKGKLVMYLRNKNAEHSTTISGISDFHILYEEVNELRKLFGDALSRVSS